MENAGSGNRNDGDRISILVSKYAHLSTEEIQRMGRELDALASPSEKDREIANELADVYATRKRQKFASQSRPPRLFSILFFGPWFGLTALASTTAKERLDGPTVAFILFITLIWSFIAFVSPSTHSSTDRTSAPGRTSGGGCLYLLLAIFVWLVSLVALAPALGVIDLFMAGRIGSSMVGGIGHDIAAAIAAAPAAAILASAQWAIIKLFLRRR